METITVKFVGEGAEVQRVRFKALPKLFISPDVVMFKGKNGDVVASFSKNKYVMHVVEVD